ncbi:RkpN putative acylneuraminate cytidylyltransferase [Profundibacterium mesophilum KAUST100406-0324]|uniref:RkpN putative acylneuraminate cytidylyltransferase n=2 Tax=Profundibacterium TaxID=1258570 RepID=A0A921NR57_9RHOB|nr:RkpN putative acylneuraminate cytidylyltransferase [Profundibacterium mesophilum KAUST100406-0324]
MGRPMIHWAIRAARAAGCFERIIVSTDDEEIAAQARSVGAEIPFMRPGALSDDHATTAQVVHHALEQLAAAPSGAPDRLCTLYATAPFVRAEDLARGAELLETHDFAVSVTRYAFPVQRALRITPEGSLDMIAPEHLLTRSQDLEETWHDAGQFYWGRTSAWRSSPSPLCARSAPIELPRWRVVDIDTEEDWALAEAMARGGLLEPVPSASR